MAIQTFLSDQMSADSVKAKAPVVGQAFLEIAEATGDAPQDLLTALVSGDAALFSGNLINSGCLDLELTISYVDGQDCDVCTVDTLSTVDVTYYVKKNRQVTLPVGLVSGIQVTTGVLDGAGTFVATPVPVGTVQEIQWDSCFTPSCASTVLVP